MSELVQYQQPESELVQWARSASEAHRIAKSLAGTPFVSSTMRGKPDDVTAAILTGQEIGLQPMSALRSIDVIQGTPAIRAVAMRGLVQSHGHELWVESSTDSKAVVKGRRKGSEIVQSSTWTMERANRLGLTGKDNWKKQPGAMLVARATAELCRLVASDVLLGIPYAVEELDELTDEQPAPRRVQRRAVAASPAATQPAAPETPSRVDSATGELSDSDETLPDPADDDEPMLPRGDA